MTDVALDIHVATEWTTTHDIFQGEIHALLAAGVIEQKHFEPQAGRRKGCTHFMPDGSPVPSGLPIPSLLPGVVSVYCRADGKCEVKKAVSADQRRARDAAEPTLFGDYRGCKRYRGDRERLVRDGVRSSWLDGLPLPGKKRGHREIHEGEFKIAVFANEGIFKVQVTHIDYYKDWGRDLYLQKRAEYGLPLIVRGHLTLVWSRPEVNGARHGRA
ncbi:hypothetical protein [Variovorax paradoxus]|uniref:Uncharacterized protein n=1 Tax=Variovorax paradoxus (strain EPS) TaxID=595537 RepID=E6V3Q9_VARPE|nr:hypothetical protein [Variovorax paradoxus]ADU36933.1 hypothetical protein Varpa_2735 [Variovorax paradoxus EPS]